MQSPFWSLFLILTVDPNITVFNKQPKKGCMFQIGLMFLVKFIIVTGTNNRDVIGMIGSVVRYCSKNFHLIYIHCIAEFRCKCISTVSLSVFLYVSCKKETALFNYPRIRSWYVPLYLIESISSSYKRKNLVFG